MTKNEIETFFSKITDQAFNELDGDGNSETLDSFFIGMIKMMDELCSEGMDYIGSEDWDEMIKYYKEMATKENEIKKKFPSQVVSFLNEWDVDTSALGTSVIDIVIFYPTDDIKNWNIKDSMRMVGKLVSNGIFLTRDDNGFGMTNENYELLKKAARIYGII